MGPGFAVLPAPSYGRTTEFWKCLFMQQAEYCCYLHPTMGQLRCYETCSQPPRTLVAKAKHIADICRLTLLSQHAANLPASAFTANPPRTGHNVNHCHLSCPAHCPAKSQGVGGSCPGLAGQQGYGGLSSPHLSTICNVPRQGLETRSDPNAKLVEQEIKRPSN